ncbi:hypothetical protein BDV96DRAFT_591303 [Lophiotrema nucula]|uniref:Uncharacterized protein n=1 Tax=Lophiotrema nucula TaxID=690887 RepID=A0A6A5YH83_9PLEO|nr:hypothetical protein BDV96DRAFT_591303 [Lophiotrema nucula]
MEATKVLSSVIRDRQIDYNGNLSYITLLRIKTVSTIVRLNIRHISAVITSFSNHVAL